MRDQVMKALSIKSPWWEKIVSGEKTIETRTWKTKHRGPILICASKPKGAAVAVANLVCCRPMVIGDVPAACCPLVPRTYAWVLENVLEIKQFPVKGQLGLFNVKDPAVIEYYPREGK